VVQVVAAAQEGVAAVVEAVDSLDVQLRYLLVVCQMMLMKQTSSRTLQDLDRWLMLL